MRTKLLYLFVILTLIVSLFGIALPTSMPAAARTTASWTFMVYMDGDNNLEECAIGDFMEMASVGSTADVNIMTQFDRIGSYSDLYGDWETCKRFHIINGMEPTEVNQVADIGEVNMGDPATLVSFVNWAVATYPAANYALVLWNHGSGWKRDASPPSPLKGVCWDDTSDGDYLTTPELSGALGAIKTQIGRNLDIVGFDACLMGMAEVDYQIQPYADYRVGSEEIEPGNGWPYDAILGALVATPTMTPDALAGTIVTQYDAFYTTNPFDGRTQSAVDLIQVPALATAISSLATALMSSDWNEVADARNTTETFYDPDFIDLYHFCSNVEATVSNTDAVARAGEVKSKITTAVVSEAHGMGHSNAAGISIYFPPCGGSYMDTYGGLDFASTQWDEFIQWFLGQAPEEPTWAEIITDGNDVEGPDIQGVDGYLDAGNVLFRVRTYEAIDINNLLAHTFLDIDQNPATSVSKNDIGADFCVQVMTAGGGGGAARALPVPEGETRATGLYCDLFGWDGSNWQWVQELPLWLDTNYFWFPVPLDITLPDSTVISDDGAMDVVQQMGTLDTLTDTAPNTGHGTIEPPPERTWQETIITDPVGDLHHGTAPDIVGIDDNLIPPTSPGTLSFRIRTDGLINFSDLQMVMHLDTDQDNTTGASYEGQLPIGSDYMVWVGVYPDWGLCCGLLKWNPGISDWDYVCDLPMYRASDSTYFWFQIPVDPTDPETLQDDGIADVFACVGLASTWGEGPGQGEGPTDCAPNDGYGTVGVPAGGGGSISGHVYQSNGTTPISGAPVGVFGYNSQTVYGWISTDANGYYQFTDLSSGDYAVRVEADGYSVEWYDGVIDKRYATPVSVTAPGDTSGINFTLEPGGSISGHITDNVTGAPISGARIDVFDYDSLSGWWVNCEGAWTGSDGSYKTGGLPTGDWAVRVVAEGYATEWYQDTYNFLEATPVPVTIPNDTQNINFSLDLSGSISGTVIADEDQQPIANLHIDAEDYETNEWMSCTNTNSDGNYTLSGLPAGTYRVRACPSNNHLPYADEFYNDTHNYQEANSVPVIVSQNTPSINFSLAPGGTISGVVSNTSGSATLANVSVECGVLIDGDFQHVRGVTTDGEGNYTFQGLSYGDYVVRSPGGGRGGENDDNYITEYYNERGSRQDADTVTVADGVNPPNINFTLEVGGSISGRVTYLDSVTSVGIANCHVYATDAADQSQWMAGTNTDADGNFTLFGLPIGSYKVRACPSCSDLNYIGEWYNDTYIWDDATPVSVTIPDDTPSIDFVLEVEVPRATIGDAIADGVAWLAGQQNTDDGSWGTYYQVAKTGLAVLKLETHAADLEIDPFSPDYLYHAQVEAGLDYLFANAYTTSISVQPAGNPDGDGDGIGVYFRSPSFPPDRGGPVDTYETSIAMMAIAASGAPERVINVTGSPVNGWTYQQVLQDAVDYIAWAQTDSGFGRGGWSYEPMNNNGPRSDQSNSGWASLALAYAKDFGVNTPGFVRTELDTIWIDYVQNDVDGDENDGGADYTGPSCPYDETWVNMLKTGNLLQQMAFVGDTVATPRVQDAIDYLVRHWNDDGGAGWRQHPTCYHTTYTVMKGLEALSTEENPMNTIDSIDWFQGFTDAILGEQAADGWWPASSWDDGERILSTEWALLTLQRAIPPTEEKPDLVVGEKHEEWVDEAAGTYRVYYTVKNRGNTATSRDFGVEVIVDEVPVGETAAFPVLAPGESLGVYSATILLTGNSDEITVCADSFGVIDELNEDNNCITNFWPLTLVNITIQPPEREVVVGETFDLIIQAEAGSQLVSGISAFINFIPAYLEVQDANDVHEGIQILPGSTLSAVLQNSADNLAGTINYSAGKLGTPFPSGTFTVATIQFKALAETDLTTAITFSTTAPRETMADYGGNNVTGTITGGTVKITSGALVDISAVLQGGSRPDAGWVIPITIKFFSPGADVLNDIPIYEFDLTTTKADATATCQCASVTPDTYDITAVSEHTLMNVRRSAVISAPFTTAMSMGTLLEGNANDDNIINISDFGILAVSFMKLEGQVGYDARADFDRNGIINISDFGLLAVNFMKMSPQAVSGIKIAYSMPITGVAAGKGTPMAHGMMDCIKYINEDLGGVEGYPIDLLWYDNGYDAAKAIDVYNMAKGNGALFLMHCSSKMTMAVLPHANADEFPLISIYSVPACFHPPTHDYGVMPDYGDDFSALIQWVVDNWDYTSRPDGPNVALYGLNNLTGHSAAEAARALDEMGLAINVVGDYPYWTHSATVTSAQANAALQEIQTFSPDWLYISSTPAPSAAIVKEARNLGMTAGIGLGHAGCNQAFIDLAGGDAEGVYGVFPAVGWGDDVPGMPKMIEYCLNLHPEDEGNLDYMLSWASSLIGAEALREAVANVGYDGLNPQAVEMQGIRQVTNFSDGGFLGPVDWTDDYDRRGAKSVNLYVVQSGAFTLVEPWLPAPVIHYEDFSWW